MPNLTLLRFITYKWALWSNNRRLLIDFEISFEILSFCEKWLQRKLCARKLVSEDVFSRAWTVYKSRHLNNLQIHDLWTFEKRTEGIQQWVLMQVTSRQLQALEHQVMESVYIERGSRTPGECLNLKSEWAGSKIFGLRVSRSKGSMSSKEDLREET